MMATTTVIEAAGGGDFFLFPFNLFIATSENEGEATNERDELMTI